MNYDKNKVIEKIKNSKCIIDSHTHVGVSLQSYLDMAYPYALSFEDLVIRMRLLGIRRSVVFPYGASSYYIADKIKAARKDLEIFSAFPYEKENNNLFNEIFNVFPEYSDLAIPFAMFDPSIKTEEQVQCLEKLAGEYPLFGLKTVTSYCQSYVSHLESKGACILNFAREKKIPLLFHCAYYKNDPWASVFDIIDIAERNLDIKICIAHSARFVKSVLDRANALPNCFVDLSAFKIHCDLAASNHEALPLLPERFDADYSNSEEVMKKIVESYPDTIIWGSDTPGYYFIKNFIDSTGKVVEFPLRCRYDREMEILKSLPPSYIDKITYLNTLEYLFN
jgi:predicted TIM-barrel fold metal-dependent hydrolase